MYKPKRKRNAGGKLTTSDGSRTGAPRPAEAVPQRQASTGSTGSTGSTSTASDAQRAEAAARRMEREQRMRKNKTITEGFASIDRGLEQMINRANAEQIEANARQQYADSYEGRMAERRAAADETRQRYNEAAADQARDAASGFLDDLRADAEAKAEFDEQMRQAAREDARRRHELTLGVLRSPPSVEDMRRNAAAYAAQQAAASDSSDSSDSSDDTDRTDNPSRGRRMARKSKRTPNHHRTGLIGQDYPIDPYRSDLDKAYDPYDRYWRTGNPAAKPTKYYRGGGEGMDSIPRDISVWDVVVFEREELGNSGDAIVPLFSEEILRKIPASRTQWLARTRKVASRYGRAEAMTYRDPVELVADNEDGYIVIERQSFDYYTSGARSENPPPAHQDPNTEGLKRLRLFFDGDYTRFSPKSEWKVGIVNGRAAAVHKRTGSLIEPLWAPKGGLRYHAVLVEDDGRHRGLSEDKTVEAVYNDIVAALYAAGRARNPGKQPAIPNLKVGDIVTVQDASNWSTTPYERRVLKVMKTRFDVGGVGPFDAYTLMQMTSGKHGLESTVVAVNGVPVRGRTPLMRGRVRNAGLDDFNLRTEFAEEIRTMADRHSVLHKYAPALYKLAEPHPPIPGLSFEGTVLQQVLALVRFVAHHLLPDVAAAVGSKSYNYQEITELPPAVDRATLQEYTEAFGYTFAPQWQVSPPDGEASRALDKRLEKMHGYAHEAIHQAYLAIDFLERYERAAARRSSTLEAMVSNPVNLRAFRELPIVAAYAVESAALARVPLKVLERAMREGL